MYDTRDDNTAVGEGQSWDCCRPALLLLALLFLVACRAPAAPPTATRVAAAATPTDMPATEPPPATPTVPPVASETPLLRTPATEEMATPLPATVEPTPSPIAPGTLAAATVPTATVTVSPESSSLFQRVDNLATGAIGGLWPAPDGSLWVLAEAGVFAVSSGGIQRLAERPPLAVLGSDRLARSWVLFDDGQTLGAYQAGTWTFYGPDQGWEVATEAVFGRGDEVVVDGEGRIWLALGRAGLRRFDPGTGTWTTVGAAAAGFGPPPSGDQGLFAFDPRLAFTDVALDSFGNLWTSACAVRVMADGPLPLLLGEGQGVRWFNGEEWAGPGESDGRCVEDIEVDGQGNVWLAGAENDLWAGNAFVRYEPDSGQWFQVPVPESEESLVEHPRFVRAFWFDGSGRMWMHVERRGGAAFAPDAVYYRDSGEWLPFLALLPGQLAGTRERALWLFLEESADALAPGLYRYGESGFSLVPAPLEMLDTTTLTVDNGGRAWFVGQDGESLWVYAGP